MLAFNLVQGVDVEETEEKIAKFQMEHAQQITDNAKKEKAEKKMRTTALDAERDAKIKERNAILEAEAKEAREKKEEKEQLLRELVRSLHIEFPREKGRGKGGKRIGCMGVIMLACLLHGDHSHHSHHLPLVLWITRLNRTDLLRLSWQKGLLSRKQSVWLLGSLMMPLVGWLSQDTRIGPCGMVPQCPLSWNHLLIPICNFMSIPLIKPLLASMNRM